MPLAAIDLKRDALLAEVGGAGLPPGACRYLHLGMRTANFLFLRDGRPEKGIDLELGVGTIADSFFRREIPSEADVENAINHIEDELQSDPGLVNRSETLLCADALFAAAFSQQAGTDAAYSRQAVEEAFTRYALVSMGRSPVYDDVRMDRSTYAGILILREILHHLDFGAVVIRA